MLVKCSPQAVWTQYKKNLKLPQLTSVVFNNTVLTRYIYSYFENRQSLLLFSAVMVPKLGKYTYYYNSQPQNSTIINNMTLFFNVDLNYKMD